MFEEMTFENIIAAMMEDMPDGLDTSEGSLIYHACAKCAARLEEAYTELSRLNDNMYPDTADLEHLILFGQERGVYIEDATAAIFEAQFNTAVEIGTEFSGDDYNYIVTELIDDTEHRYRLECEEDGSEPNGWLGELMCLDDVEDLETAVLTKLLVEGKDEEDEESYRMRLLESFEIQPFAGNRAYYKQEINAIDGVGGAKIYRKNSGGAIDIVIIADDYSVPSAEQVRKVQEQIDPVNGKGNGDGIAPIGHYVEVKGVVSITITVKAEITCEIGYTIEGLQSQIENAVEKYFLSLRKKWSEEKAGITVRKSGVENAIYVLEGIQDVRNVLLDDATENITLQETEVPIRGEVTCN